MSKIIRGISKKITTNEQNLYILQKHKTFFNSAEEEYEYAIENTKVCSKCGETKTLNSYSGNTSGCDAFDKEGYRLRRPECKTCTTKVKQGQNKAIQLSKQLGIPHKAPEGTRCAITGKLPKNNDKLVFDHCHKTNVFRGYILNNYNRSMGVLGDDVEGLLQVVNYLNKTEKKTILQNKETGELFIA